LASASTSVPSPYLLRAPLPVIGCVTLKLLLAEAMSSAPPLACRTMLRTVLW